MPHRLELLDPRTDLCVRVKLMLESAHGAGFIGQVRFRHPYIGGTEDTFAGTRIWLRQNSDGRHAGKRAHRFHADALKQARVLLHLSRRNHLVVNRYQHGFVEITTAWQRMTAQSLGHIAPASNFLEHSACQILFILGEEMGGAPKFLSFCLHDPLVFTYPSKRRPAENRQPKIQPFYAGTSLYVSRTRFFRALPSGQRVRLPLNQWLRYM